MFNYYEVRGNYQTPYMYVIRNIKLKLIMTGSRGKLMILFSDTPPCSTQRTLLIAAYKFGRIPLVYSGNQNTESYDKKPLQSTATRFLSPLQAFSFIINAWHRILATIHENPKYKLIWIQVEISRNFIGKKMF